MKPVRLLLLLPVLALIACSNNPPLDLPKGTSKGYQTIALQARSTLRDTPAKYKQGQSWVRSALMAQLEAGGLQVVEAGQAQLRLAHLVIVQDDGTTSALPEYFGSGLEAEAIADLAHQRGVVEKDTPEYLRRAGLVVDILDASTDELLYRHYVVRDILPAGTPAAVRKQIISEAAAEVLQPFLGIGSQ